MNVLSAWPWVAGILAWAGLVTGIILFFRWAAIRVNDADLMAAAEAPAPADPRVPGPAPVPGDALLPPSAPPSRPGHHSVRPAPAPGCSLCGWHTAWCGQCGRKVAVRERCPAHEEAPR